MASVSDRDLVRAVISSCRYLTLATSDGKEPWAAPIEFVCDDDLNFFFLSTRDCLHARHIEANPNVALAIFETEQPAYSPALTAPLRGVQVQAVATRLSPEQYPESIAAVVAAVNPPMPPYSVFKLTPTTFHLPKVVDGINKRVAVPMSGSSGSDDAH